MSIASLTSDYADLDNTHFCGGIRMDCIWKMVGHEAEVTPGVGGRQAVGRFFGTSVGADGYRAEHGA